MNLEILFREVLRRDIWDYNVTNLTWHNSRQGYLLSLTVCLTQYEVHKTLNFINALWKLQWRDVIVLCVVHTSIHNLHGQKVGLGEKKMSRVKLVIGDNIASHIKLIPTVVQLKENDIMYWLYKRKLMTTQVAQKPVF